MPWWRSGSSQVHLVDEVPDRRRHPVGRLARPVDPDAHVKRREGRGVPRIGGLEPGLLLVERPDLGRGFDLEAAEAGPDPHDRHDPRGRQDRGVEGEHPSERVADQCRPADPGGIEDRKEVVDPRELDRFGGRAADAALVVADAAVPGRGQRPDHRVPRPNVGDPGMKEQDRRA